MCQIINMADGEKNARGVAKGKFTKSQKSFLVLLEEKAEEEIVRRAYESMNDAFDKLDNAHEAYIIAAGIDLDNPANEAEAAYLEQPSEDRLKATVGYSKYIKGLEENRAEQVEKVARVAKRSEYDAKMASLQSNIRSFGEPSKVIGELCEEGNISFADMRQEIQNVEIGLGKLVEQKRKLIEVDPTRDAEDLEHTFNAKVVKEVQVAKKLAMVYVKDEDSTSTATLGGGGSARGGYSSTKKEAVKLPKFSGDEKTAFLKYPIWKKQWESQITEYEARYRPGLLMEHLDDAAQRQIIGVETEYGPAMTKLENYFGDSLKVVNACLSEVKVHPNVSPFDYKAMVSYKKCLVNNHARLKARGLEHELSNTGAMQSLLRKLPIQENVQWQQHLAEQDPTIKSRPFPEFMTWLEKAGKSWDLLAAAGTGVSRKDGKAGSGAYFGFYGEPSNEDMNCFKCGESGHFKRDCPKLSGAGRHSTGGGGKGRGKPETDETKPRAPTKHKKFHCALHKAEEGRRCHSDSCLALKKLEVDERIKLLKENGDCPKCCRDCPKGDCQARVVRVCGGNKEGRGCSVKHEGHEMFCSKAKLCFTISSFTTQPLSSTDTAMNVQGWPEEMPVRLQVMKIPNAKAVSAPYETVLWDSACTGIFVRNEHARMMKFPSKSERMVVYTLGGDTKQIDGIVYKCKIKDLDGKIHEFIAHGLDDVTGTLGQPLSMMQIRNLFPHIKSEKEQRMLVGATKVDYLIGLSKASWQPQMVTKAREDRKGESDFWIWENQFGRCVGGSHPSLQGGVTRSDSLYSVVNALHVNHMVEDSLKIPSPCKLAEDRSGEEVESVGEVELKGCYKVSGKVGKAQLESCEAKSSSGGKMAPTEMNNFFKSEQLGTIVEPKCGSCRCGHCPVPGSRYSFREESELKLVEENLSYDDEKGSWVTKYPYLYPRELLKGTREVAEKSMLAAEKSLKKDITWGKVYQSQIDDMVERGAARKVSLEEMEAWSGHVNYLPHLAVLNPRSSSTPVRLCFDASRPQGGGPSLNQILAKGPDRYLNNLAAVILCFRCGRVAAKGDVKKMYNCVELVEEDCYVQCFLWRDMDETKKPEIYQVIVNNIGVKPAGSIATTALYRSADAHGEQFPETVRQLKRQSYVDDIGLTDNSKKGLDIKMKEADIVLKHANMKVKGWVCSGDDNRGSMEMGDVTSCLTAEDEDTEKVLGILWCPKKDVFKFRVRINLTPMKKKSRTGPDLTKEDLLSDPPTIVTRRQYYSQVQALFDPIGLLSSLLLQAKILLRMTWEGDCKDLGWDDPLPSLLVKEIIKFFIDLYELEEVEFARSLWPQEEVVGDPWLVTLSDGSILAFGANVYIVWKLISGERWATLVVSKSKIAPKNRISVPRLELNGAVLNKRLTEFVSSSLSMNFERKIHLVDSSTVLGYVHKEDAKLKPYEGIRVSEIQTAGEFVNGRLKDWAWVEGKDNVSDWSTKPRSASELKAGGFWQKGPHFLTLPFEDWPIKQSFRTDRLEGELVAKEVHLVMPADIVSRLDKMLSNCSKASVLQGSVVNMFRIWTAAKQVGGGKKLLERLKVDLKTAKTVQEFQQSKNFLNKFVQLPMKEDLEKSVSRHPLDEDEKIPVKVRGPYKRLSPFEDEEGVWRVGIRMKEFTPFTEDKKPPVLLPYHNRYTLLIMSQCHERGHMGITATVSKFRSAGYWTPRAAKLARRVRNSCVICRWLDHNPINQVMGGVPKERLLNPMAWGHVELDLFGPFLCRSDVNKRSNMKVWGAVLEDKNSGAVHCDIVTDYSAPAVVTTLRRFGSLRGWPAKISSDPGTQLESASGQMSVWWDELKEPLLQFAGANNFDWEISPANSPWRQGKAEVRIKIIKRLLLISVGDSKLSPTELQTFMFEAADMANERPIGINSAVQANGCHKILTPNCLLMGRSSSKMPDDTFLAENLKKGERYRLIQQATAYFWSKWSEEVTPMSVIRAKWHETGRNLRTGDIVLLHDKSQLKGKYQLGVVESVEQSADGFVRSCTVGYRIPKAAEPASVYTGGRWISVTRSVQRLTLLLPVEEQAKPLTVENEPTGPVVKIDSEKDEHETPKENLQAKVIKKKKKEKWILSK